MMLTVVSYFSFLLLLMAFFLVIWIPLLRLELV